MKSKEWSASAPRGGWKEETYYVVEVSFRNTNPKHRAILYTGFLNESNGMPENYSCIFNPTYEPPTLPIEDLFSVRVIQEIIHMKEAIGD